MAIQGMEGSASVTVSAPQEKVWALVADVTRMGEWSPETLSAEWIDGATGPAVGARFKGKNKRGWMKWSTKCTVVTSEPGREFTFVVGTPEKAATRWSYTFVPDPSGTKVTESWESLRYGVSDKLFQPVKKTIAALNDGVQRTLQNLKAKAEGG